MSDPVREKAIMICSIAACNPEFENAYHMVCDALGIEWAEGDDLAPAADLALAAWSYANLRTASWDDVDAEAEALLRTGWKPGDP